MGSSQGDNYDKQAEATAWHGPEVVFGLMYEHVQAGEAILDIGVGTGLSSAPFYKAGLKTHGIDSSNEMLESVVQKGIAETLMLHDITTTPYPYEECSFDHAVCVGTLQFVPDVESVFQEVRRVLRVRGMFAFTLLEQMPGEAASRAGGTDTVYSHGQILMYKHDPDTVRRHLEETGLTIYTELEFAAFMNADKSSRMLMRAYVAERG